MGRLADLRPDQRNANKGTERGRGMLEDSIQRYGAGRSILVDKHGVAIGGNKTLEAAAAAGLDEMIVVPSDGRRLVVVQRTDLDIRKDPEAAALAVADNRVAEVSLDWDPEVIQGLIGDGVDLSRLFTAEELAQLFDGSSSGRTDPDALPARRPTDVAVGGLYELGRHRLLCGDSTNREHAGRVLGSSRPPLMVTDPPYGVSYDPAWRREAGVNNSERMGKVANDERVDWTAVWEIFPGDVAYVYHAGVHAAAVQASLERARFEIRAQIIWRKSRMVLSRGHYHWQHEPCWYAVRKGGQGHWAGKRNQATVWSVMATVHRCSCCGSTEIESETGELPSTVWDIKQRDATGDTTHGTQKPVDCMARAIRNHTVAEVFEPFSGSGTTIIAAEITGRSAIAIELDPGYVQQAIDRWEAFTGQKAVKAGEVLVGA